MINYYNICSAALFICLSVATDQQNKAIVEGIFWLCTRVNCDVYTSVGELGQSKNGGRLRVTLIINASNSCFIAMRVSTIDGRGIAHLLRIASAGSS